MKHNINKNKINYRSVHPIIRYSKYKGHWIIDYFYDNYKPIYIRNPRHHRNKIQAKNHKDVIDNYDDLKISRNYRSWKDRTKRKHQYKYENNDDFGLVYKYGNI